MRNSIFPRRKAFSLIMSAILILSLTTIITFQARVAEGDLAVTDFNGDGYSDLAIGVPGEAVSGKNNAGAVNVIYGSAAGLSATAAKPDQIWTQDSNGINDSAEGGDSLGWAVATGDFNNDGYTDLAIGAPRESIGSKSTAGAVNVIYGSSGGLRSTPALDGTGREDQFWHQDSAEAAGTAENSDLFGWTLTSGDFNGDGFGDLAIAAPYEDIGVKTDAGSVNILFGSQLGLSATAPLADQVWDQSLLGTGFATGRDDNFGSSLSAGDFNNDGFFDLAIGVPNESLIGSSDSPDSGEVNILYGSTNGLTAAGAQAWNQDSPGIEFGAQQNDNFGSSVAAGDFNKDGFSDLAIGVPFEIGVSGTAGGEVDVLYGSSTGLSATGVQGWNQASPGVPDDVEPGEDFGNAVATGDFNNDGYDDLAVGIPSEDVGFQNAGAVNVIYGSSFGLSGSGSQFWNQDSVAIEGTPEERDVFGYTLASGDFNGDSFSDLVVSVFGEGLNDINDNSFEDAGAINVIYGSSSKLSANAALADQVWHQNTPSVEDSIETDERFGWSVASSG